VELELREIVKIQQENLAAKSEGHGADSSLPQVRYRSINEKIRLFLLPKFCPFSADFSTANENPAAHFPVAQIV
jgi:hypothetical protein